MYQQLEMETVQRVDQPKEGWLSPETSGYVMQADRLNDDFLSKEPIQQRHVTKTLLALV